MCLRPLDPLVGDVVVRMATALLEAATDDPDDDGQLLRAGVAGPRPPDVEIQAVLALGIAILVFRHELPEHADLVSRVLEADGLVGLGIVGTVFGRLLGWHKATRADGRTRVGDAEPLVGIGEAWVDEAGERAAGRLDREALPRRTWCAL